ncbi:MAG TPA: outer membrane beta-barrel protein [Verrucomicrobiae bacterium]|nr:outer membrane beta-barrel protein [Verrucomicrobiae bacterium]
MNPKIITIAVAAIVAGGPALIRAEDNSDRFYVHADSGAVFVQDLTLRASVPGSPSTSASFAMHFQPGARGDIAIGYNLTDSLAVEIETGALWNRIDTVNSIDLFQVPLLENLVYRVHLKNGWTPYFGAGAGADFGILSGIESISHGDVIQTSSSDDVTFGYQAQAGIAYAISPNADVDFSYKFFGSFEHNWDFPGVKFDSDKIYTHALLLSFRWKF